jgi:hypothetical protein
MLNMFLLSHLDEWVNYFKGLAITCITATDQSLTNHKNKIHNVYKMPKI